MRPVSHQLLAAFPAIIACALMLLSAAPLDAEYLTFTPNVAWLMTLILVGFYPPSWPRGFAFALGLLQDILFGTPLGAQALLTLLLAQLTGWQMRHQQTKLFRIRWLEAAGMLVLWHVLLWALLHAVNVQGPALRSMIGAGVVNALWYPVFYWFTTRAFAALPDAK